jgi:drug/metabolite transporter (DMT)-like permease
MVVGNRVLGDRITWRMVVGAAIGIIGIGLVFSPEIRSLEISAGALSGLLFALGGTLSASIGMISSARFQREGYPVLQTNTWGMTWGACWMLLYILLADIPFDVEPSGRYVGSMLFLSIFSTVIGFGCFLTLVGRIGAGRASYAMVMFPIVALLISTAFEGYTWSIISVVGLGLAILGNVVILMDRQGVLPGKTASSPA